MPVTSKLVRFGIFEIDLNTGEFTKNGRRLKLQEQPFRILSLLLQQPGQTVTREELKDALWPSDTFVDFDHSLNAAIAKLRQALGDTAENPRFIETLARRGYRFLAPVEFKNGSSGTPLEAARANPPVATIPKAKSSNITLVLGIGIAAAVALLAVGLWFRHKSRPAQAKLVQLTDDPGLTMDPAVSPDGKLLAYASDRADGRNLNIWIEQLSSPGNAVQLTHEEADTRQPSFSPDGSKIVFRSGREGGGIYVIPTIGGDLTRLAAAGRDPRFSPDGRWIAYWTGDYDTSIVTGSRGGQLYVVPADGGEARRVGSDLPAGANPVWSPDSKHLLVFVPPEVTTSMDWWSVSIDGERSRPTGIINVLKQQGFSFGGDRLPHVSQWARGFILFSASYGDAVNVWRMPVSDSGHSTGSAERLSSGTTLEVSPVLTPSGDLIFASLNLDSSVWGLAADTDRGQVTGDLKKVTGGSLDVVPSISLDGRKLAFAAIRRTGNARTQVVHSGAFVGPPSTWQIRVRDLLTQKETVVAHREHPASSRLCEMHPVIAHDGTLIAYTPNQTFDLFIGRPGMESPRLLVENTKGFVTDWSCDNKHLLLNNRADGNIDQVDVSSGHQSLFLSKAGYELFQAKFSPDSRAVSLIGCDSEALGTQCRVFIVPLKSEGTPEADKWIAIDHPSPWDDKPRWSPDGSLLYFASDRDGHLCLWAQRLGPITKQPNGAPFPVWHFHNSRLAMINIGTSPIEIDVARDKIIMAAGELTGNIWSLKR